MNDKAVYRTTPATPGLLNNGKNRVYKHMKTATPSREDKTK